MRVRTTSLAAGLLALALGLPLAGCGGDDESSSSTTGSSAASSTASAGSGYGSAGGQAAGGGGGTTLQLAADPSGKLAFDKTSLEAKAGKVTIDFTNDSSTPHAVEVEGNGVEEETDTVTDGKASVTVDLQPGTYEFYCPVDGHEAAGMKGELTVR
ncbi:MAG TPA: plastocyanin/azurin family copper-binding protein [Capillimicrobium sp.]|nr:plastocyanin/azurin family copper-binding protein [Capillimicrobium sp.]